MVLFYSSSSADLNSFVDLPNDFASPGSLFAPNNKSNIDKIINNSGNPNLLLFFY